MSDASSGHLEKLQSTKKITIACVFSLLQVFKVLVRKTPDESWVVFRRYTDFSRLNDKVFFFFLVFFGKLWGVIWPVWSFYFNPFLQLLFVTIYLSLSACFSFVSEHAGGND